MATAPEVGAVVRTWNMHTPEGEQKWSGAMAIAARSGGRVSQCQGGIWHVTDALEREANPRTFMIERPIHMRIRQALNVHFHAYTCASTSCTVCVACGRYHGVGAAAHE